MATESVVRKKPNAFGDAAAQMASPGTSPAPLPLVGQPTPLPMLTSPKPTPMASAALAAPPVVPVAPVAGAGAAPAAAPPAPLDARAAADRAAIVGGAQSVAGGAVDSTKKLGAAALDLATLVPRAGLGAWDSTVVRGARAAGLNVPFSSPLLLPAGGDPSSMTPYSDALGRPAPAAAAPVAAAVPAATAMAAPAAGVSPVLGGSGQGRGTVNPGMPTAPVVPVAAPAAAVAAPVAAVAAGQRANPLGSMADTKDQLANIMANNAAIQPGGMGVIGNPGPGAAQEFFDNANLRNAAAKGSWSPRRGYQGDDDAVKAAMVPIANRQQSAVVDQQNAGQAAVTATREAGDNARARLRDTGDTARTNIRETGDQARAQLADARGRDQLEIQRGELGIKRDTANIDNGSRAQLAQLQTAVISAKTPEERQRAADTLAAVSGKNGGDNYTAVDVGGGQVLDPTGQLITQPKTIAVVNKRTGQVAQQPGAASNTPAAPAVAPPTNAVSMLKSNPQMAAQFDAKYGVGASARALGQAK